jgi:hypothetical protein
MASNADIKQHISISERAKWNKVIVDFGIHLGSVGVENHKLGNGTLPGFSTNDYSNIEKTKLAGIEDHALNNPHPATHPWTMITGLVNIANTGSWNDLKDIPKYVMDVVNGVHDSLTTSGGIRITIGTSAPPSPINNKEIWIDTNALVLKIMHSNSWKIIGAAFR